MPRLGSARIRAFFTKAKNLAAPSWIGGVVFAAPTLDMTVTARPAAAARRSSRHGRAKSRRGDSPTYGTTSASCAPCSAGAAKIGVCVGSRPA
jgi:hypothetical protein